MNTTQYVVRRVRRDDLDTLVALCGEHALYEKASHDAAGKAEALSRALFSTPARLHAWVVESAGELIGYATATLEFSTWQVGEFLHMDCLFVRAGRRGSGAGAALLQAVRDFAGRTGCREMQWQTPEWNVDAMRFYRRFGAVDKAKRRFFLPLASAQPE